MTPIDRFERQLPAALTDLAGPRTPDYLIDILGQTARTSQRSAWASIERWLPMRASTSVPAGGSTTRRLTIVAIVAALLLVVVAMVALSGGRPSPLPAVVTDASAEPSAVAVASAAPSGPAAYASPRPLPAALIGGWVRPAGDDWSLVSSQVATVFFDGPGGDPASPDYGINRPNLQNVQGSDVKEVAPGVIAITSSESTGNCQHSDAGRYAWSVTGDGQWMTLTPDGVDACATRGRILAGTWQRSLAHDNIGGPGIATNFLPHVAFALPRETWIGGGANANDQVVVDRADGSSTFKIWKDLDGFNDPCDIDAGRKVLPPGMDGFLGYLNGDPRFTVDSQQEFTIDGHRAVEVAFTIGKDIEPPCWDLDGNPDDKTGVLQWATHASTDGFWNSQINGPGLVVVTEVGDATFVFEAASGSGNAWTTDRDTLETVRFLDTLPTPPAS